MFPTGDDRFPGKGLGVVTIVFIALNVLVFLFLQGAGANETFTYGYAAVPLEITTGDDLTTPQVIDTSEGPIDVPQEPGPNPIYLTLLTSMFMHAGWLHLIGNMVFLWVFGDNVEHAISRGLYVLFYLIAGIVASLAQILINPDSPIPSLGASGAVSGVLGAYLVLFPRNRVRVMIGLRQTLLPAIVVIGMWAVFQFINGAGAFAVSEETTGGVAYMAHIGGFVIGLIGGALARSAGAHEVGSRAP